MDRNSDEINPIIVIHEVQALNTSFVALYMSTLNISTWKSSPSA